MNRSDTLGALAAALSAAQAELKPAAMNATNPFLKSKYADLGSVIDAARPVLAKHGLSYSQLTVGDGQTIGVETILMHSSGEWLASQISLPMMEERGKSAAQVAGSIITYLRRYALASALGIYADEDTDGHVPEKPVQRRQTAARAPSTPPSTPETGELITDAQMRKLRAVLAEVGMTDRDEILAAAADVIGHPIESSKDLTKREAGLFIDVLEGGRK